MFKKRVLSIMLSAAMLLGSSGFSFADTPVQQNGAAGNTTSGNDSVELIGPQIKVWFSGKNRFETSERAAEIVKSNTLIVADGNQFADALSAVNVAMSTGGKFLLTGKYTDITKIFKPREITRVYVVGGSVSSYVQDRAKELDPNTTYLIGGNRYETNQKTLDHFKIGSVGIADGRNFPDALSASGLLVNKKIGLKLVDGSRPYGNIKENVVYTFGGKNTVLQDGGKRLAGKDRFKTNLAINKELGHRPAVAVASGLNYPDALSSLNGVVELGATVALANGPYNSEIKEYFKKADDVYIFGGRSSVSYDELDSMLYKVNYFEDSFEDTNTNTGAVVPAQDNLVNVYDILRTSNRFAPCTSVKPKYRLTLGVPDGYVIASEFPSTEKKSYVFKKGARLVKTSDEFDQIITDCISQGLKSINGNKNSFAVYMRKDLYPNINFPNSLDLYMNSMGIDIKEMKLNGGELDSELKNLEVPGLLYSSQGGIMYDASKDVFRMTAVRKAKMAVEKMGIDRNAPAREKMEKISDWLYDNYFFGRASNFTIRGYGFTGGDSIFDIDEVNTKECANLTALLANAAGVDVQTVQMQVKTFEHIYWNRFKDGNEWVDIDNSLSLRSKNPSPDDYIPPYSFEECLARGKNYARNKYNNRDAEADNLYALLRNHGYTYLGSELN